MAYAPAYGGNPQDFVNLVSSWQGDPTKAREYAERYGYSPSQMANWYNQGVTGDTKKITSGEAAGLLGVNPSRSGQSLGSAWLSRNPRTGEFTTQPTDPANFSGWTPGSGPIDTAQPLSQMGSGFYTHVNNALNAYGKDTTAGYIRDYMTKYGYSVDDILRAYNSGGGTSSLADAQKWLGLDGFDPLKPIPNNPDMTLYGDDISNKFSRSYSGLDEDARKQLISAILPRLLGSVDQYRQDIDDSTRSAADLYRTTAGNAIKRDLQGILNNLASRNVMNSSVASDTISKGMTDIATSAGEKAYQSAMSAGALKAQEPSMLANILNLGQHSMSENQLQPYELMSKIYEDLMR